MFVLQAPYSGRTHLDTSPTNILSLPRLSSVLARFIDRQSSNHAFVGQIQCNCRIELNGILYISILMTKITRSQPLGYSNRQIGFLAAAVCLPKVEIARYSPLEDM